MTRPTHPLTGSRPSLLQEPRVPQAARPARPGGAVRRPLNCAVDPGGRASAGRAVALPCHESRHVHPQPRATPAVVCGVQTVAPGPSCAETYPLVVPTRVVHGSRRTRIILRIRPAATGTTVTCPTRRMPCSRAFDRTASLRPMSRARFAGGCPSLQFMSPGQESCLDSWLSPVPDTCAAGTSMSQPRIRFRAIRVETMQNRG